MALLAVLPNSGRRKLLAANPLNKWEKKRLSRLAYSYETMAMKAARMGEVGDENYFYGKASGLTHVTKHYGPKKNPGKKKCVSIRLQSSPFVHTPGILRWAMAGYRIPKDRKRLGAEGLEARGESEKESPCEAASSGTARWPGTPPWNTGIPHEERENSRRFERLGPREYACGREGVAGL
jgi:hypothetical protein